MPSSAAIKQIRSDEGFKPKASFVKIGKDSKKSKEFSIGHGFNLAREDAREMLILAGVSPQKVDGMMAGRVAITQPQAENLMQQSIHQAEVDADNLYFNFSTLPQTIKDTLVNMSYQLGKKGLSKFVDMKKAIENEDWVGMRREMLDSDWARDQTPSRAKRLAKEVKQVKITPISAPISKSAIARSKNVQQRYADELFNTRADQIASFLSEDALIDSMADSILELDKVEADALVAKVKLEEEATAKPALQRLEQGLFEDDSGQKFFVDDKNRLMQLGEDNQPKAIIDPSKFDLSKIEQEAESAAVIQEEIF